jgi:hypothetical protein
MQSSRRVFLSLGFPFTLFAATAAAQRWKRSTPLQTRTVETQSPADQKLAGSTPFPKPDPALLKQRQEEIKKQVQELYDLAGELKAETEKTDSASVLSLPVLKKAEKIQKIAKHIQSLARG